MRFYKLKWRSDKERHVRHVKGQKFEGRWVFQYVYCFSTKLAASKSKVSNTKFHEFLNNELRVRIRHFQNYEGLLKRVILEKF